MVDDRKAHDLNGRGSDAWNRCALGNGRRLTLVLSPLKAAAEY